MNKREILRREATKIADQIARIYKPQQIILFGSLIKENKTPTDIDLLVVKDTRKDRVKRAQELYKNLAWSHPLDIVVRTPDEIKEGLTRKNPFYLNALGGEILYESRKE